MYRKEKVLQGRKVEGTIRAKGKINGIGGQNLLLGGERGRKKLIRGQGFQKYICVQEENSGMPVFRQKPEFRPWQFIFRPYVSVVMCTN